MVKIDRVTTRGGDGGQTSLVGGRRVSKADARVEAYGSVDEISAGLGLCRSAMTSTPLDSLDEELVEIQQRLFDLGAELASETPSPEGSPRIDDDAISRLEEKMDRMNGPLEPLTSFILPGGGEVASRLHLARTICRRAERRCTELQDGQRDAFRPELLAYLNRLSDYLFVAARHASSALGEAEFLWNPGSAPAPAPAPEEQSQNRPQELTDE